MEATSEFLRKVNAEHKCAGISTVNVILDKHGIMPTRAHDLDAGIDFYAPHRIVMYPHEHYSVQTGVHLQIPEGYVGLMCNRSGLNFKQNIETKMGVIDAGYNGEIGVMLYNYGNSVRTIEKGDRITQMIILPCETPALQLVDSFEATERGDNGFGSTGR